MPFVPAQQAKCPKCGKSVYAAEERAVGDLKFHKECFKCSMCNKFLDSTNTNCHETVLYCKTCHGRKFGPKGYGFGGGAAGLSMDTGAHLDYERDDTIKEYKAPKAAPGEGCPRCGGKVFAAEEMLAKGKRYHRTCFNCKTCRKPLDSVLHCDGPDKEVYCKVCYAKNFGPKGYGFGQGLGTLQSDPDATPLITPYGNPDVIIKPAEGEEACPRCGGKVFNAELMLAKGRPFHRRCFKCRVCKRPLDSMIHCDGPDGEIYCKLCYAKKYGPKGYGFAAGSGGVLTAENIPGGEESPAINPASAALDVSSIKAAPGEGCPRCGGKVFMAEEMFARARSWHKRCFNCCHCHRPLDSVVGCDAPDGEVYCKLCYAKRYGPKGYGFASGSGGVLTAENIGGDDALQSKNIAFTLADVSKIKAEEGMGCPRCGGKVFMAEEIHARGRSWHKGCYHCCHCRRPLDSVVGCDAPDGEVYCKLCYSKKYGPKGYGFASGAGGVLTAENIPGGLAQPEINPASVAIDTKAILAAPGEGCPRCGGKVFSAEEMLSRNNKWHKRCYNCCDCHRPLDSMVQCDGPDGEIYCKLCYAKKFGPKGYGFASGAGGVLFPETLSMDEENQSYVSLNPPSYKTLDVKSISPAKEGQSRCPRCGGAVFQAEAMVARNKEWHKQCYNCVECHRPLDSMIGCDAPDGEIYCKLCYAKRHGPKGYGYGHTPALVSLGTEDGIPVPTDIRQFGFGAVKGKHIMEGNVQNSEEGSKTTHMQIINQIRNLPVAGRVPRGVDEDISKRMEMLKEGETVTYQSKGFTGFAPSGRKVSGFKEQEQVETVKTMTNSMIRTVKESRTYEETNSSVQENQNNVDEEDSKEEDEDQEYEYETRGIQVDERNHGQHNYGLVNDEPSRGRATSSGDEEAIPTSDFNAQTPPVPTNDIPLNNGLHNNNENDYFDQNPILSSLNYHKDTNETATEGLFLNNSEQSYETSMMKEQYEKEQISEESKTTVRKESHYEDANISSQYEYSSAKLVIGDSSASKSQQAFETHMETTGQEEMMVAGAKYQSNVESIPAEYGEE